MPHTLRNRQVLAIKSRLKIHLSKARSGFTETNWSVEIKSRTRSQQENKKNVERARLSSTEFESFRDEAMHR
jgi:hypothetical protein